MCVHTEHHVVVVTGEKIVALTVATCNHWRQGVCCCRSRPVLEESYAARGSAVGMSTEMLTYADISDLVTDL